MGNSPSHTNPKTGKKYCSCGRCPGWYEHAYRGTCQNCHCGFYSHRH